MEQQRFTTDLKLRYELLPVRSGGVSPLSHAARLSWVQTGTCTTTPHPGSCAGSETYSKHTLFDLSAVSAPPFGARRPNLGLRADTGAGVGSQEFPGTGDNFGLDVGVRVIDVPTDDPFSTPQCSRPAHPRVLGRSGRDHRAGRLGSKGGLETLLLCRANRSKSSYRRLKFRRIHDLSRTYVRGSCKERCA